MTKKATTSALQTALFLFEQQQREWQQLTACFDVFPSKNAIEFRAVSNRNIDSRDEGNNGRAKSRVCRKGAKAEMYS
jgi:hypothetical protein